MPVYFEGKRKKVRYGRDLVEVRFGKKTKKEAFAVFSADDGSLNFYKRVDVPKVGERFEGKTVTAVYTGIETNDYIDMGEMPWSKHASVITSVKIVDKIMPLNTCYWFAAMENLVDIDINNLDTSICTDMSYMFAYCSSLISIDLRNFNTTNVTDMLGVFAYCSSLSSIDVSNFNTYHVVDMGSMFLNCSAITTLDISNFDMSNIRHMSYMFSDCSKLNMISVNSTFNIKDIKPTYVNVLPTPSPSNIPNADGKWYALSDGKGYAPKNIPSNKADTYYAYPPTEIWNTITQTGIPAMGTSSDIFVSPSKTTKYRATLDTTSSAQGRGMSVYIYNANSGSMINNVQLSITGAHTQYFELNQGNYKINAFFDCHNGYPSTLILEEKIRFEFAPIN